MYVSYEPICAKKISRQLRAAETQVIQFYDVQRKSFKLIEQENSLCKLDLFNSLCKLDLFICTQINKSIVILKHIKAI